MKSPTTRSEGIEAVEHQLLPSVMIEGQRSTSSMAEALEEHNVPAVSVAVIAEGRIEWAHAWGRTTADGSLANSETLFQSCSISKPVAALTTLRLVASGALDLDADVDSLLRSWHIPDNPHTAGNPVTPRWLMSHRAGFNVRGFPGYAIGSQVPTLGQILRGEPPANTDALQVETAPGTAFRYSGGGTQVLQQLLEDLSGLPYSDLAKREVLDVAEMTVSTYEPSPEAAAFGHLASGKPMEGGYGIQPELAAAGLWSTPSDLARLAISMQRAYADDGGIIPRQLARAALTPVGDGPTGLGFFLESDGDRLRFSHNGGNTGFRCHLEAYASLGLGAAVMTNSDNGQILVNRIFNTIADTYGWPGFLTERKVVSVGQEVLDRYSGSYLLRLDEAPDGIPIKVAVGDGLLTFESPLGPGKLLAESETRFFGTQLPVEVEFHREDGQASGFTLVFGGTTTMEATRTDLQP